jgi:hypothetical protein
MSALNAHGRHFFPPDRKLKLREDRWSEGAARAATRQGLQAKSFELAAEAYSDVGGTACQKADTAFSHVVYP